MTIFIVGKSKTGKTTFTDALAEKYSLNVVKASAWARKECGIDESDPAFRQKISAYSIQTLRARPFHSADKIRYTLQKHFEDKHVVEGVRNPVDFMRNFDPSTDYVVFLSGTRSSPDPMDAGVDVIYRNVDWLITAGIMDVPRMFEETILENRYADPNNYRVEEDDNGHPVLHRKCS